MRKIINSVAYDTDTADCYGWYEHSIPGDFTHCWEGLYKKDNGEFFLYEGGSFNSGYFREAGEHNGRGESMNIRKMTVGEAKRWAERYMTGEEYEEAFGPVPEDTDHINVCVTLTKEVYNHANDYAKENGLTLNAAFEELFKEIAG